MTDPNLLPGIELMEHKGYQIRLSPSGLEWLVFVALPKQHPILILAPDRETALTKAYEWIDQQRAFDERPE
jgi:hypothetical protein